MKFDMIRVVNFSRSFGVVCQEYVKYLEICLKDIFEFSLNLLVSFL